MAAAEDPPDEWTRALHRAAQLYNRDEIERLILQARAKLPPSAPIMVRLRYSFTRLDRRADRMTGKPASAQKKRAEEACRR